MVCGDYSCIYLTMKEREIERGLVMNELMRKAAVWISPC